MTRHILLAILLLALGGVIYCAAIADWAFCLSFAIALLVSFKEIMEEDKRQNTLELAKEKDKKTASDETEGQE